jgi:hypothetical protein
MFYYELVASLPRQQSWALFDKISGAQKFENQSAGAQNSSQVRIKMQSRAQK